MDSIEFNQRQKRARVAYELGRLRLALLGMIPLALIVALSVAFTQKPLSAFAFGLAALGFGVGMLWYGRDPQRAILPGAVAGLVPLVFALCANRMHTCGPDGCTSLCMPACALGGIVAGLFVAIVGNRRKAGALFWLSASGLALLTGAMGCSCAEYAGLAGLGAGFTVGVMPGLIRRALTNNNPPTAS